MENFFKQLRWQEEKIAIVRERLKNGQVGNLLNVSETKEMLDMLDAGGYFLKVFKEPTARVIVLKEDCGAFEILGALSKSTSRKIYDIYSEPSPMEYSVLSLKSFIAKYC